MAAIQLRGKSYRVIFRYQEQQHFVTFGKLTPKQAEDCKARTEELLTALDRGTRELPAGCSITDFIYRDGKAPTALATVSKTTLAELREKYLAVMGNGAIETNSLATIRIHLRHFEKSLGKNFLLAALSLAKLQAYVDERSKTVIPYTAKKELTTFKACWSWGQRMNFVTAAFPSAGIVWPKSEETQPFQTWDQIQRRIKAGAGEELWEALYLDTKQIAAFLAYAKKHDTTGYVYAMLVMAGHTGARRSELLRAQVEDVDLKAGVVTIREKKRKKGTLTTRRVPISKLLATVIKPLLVAKHTYLFGNGEKPLTVDQAKLIFPQVFGSSKKWEKVRGFHALRHSFISSLACKGIDQRIIDEFSGHSTEAQRRRYRHLLPNLTKNAIQTVFG